MTDTKIELMVSKLLLSGVLLAGALVLVGGIYYVAAHGGESANYHHFVPQHAALAFRPRSIIEIGVLVLIATPILRVAIALVGFAMERDKQYVIIAAIVLALLLYSLIAGGL